MKNLDGLVPLKEAAERLGKSRYTLWRWHKESRIRLERVLGNTYVREEEIERLLKEPGLPPKLTKAAKR